MIPAEFVSGLANHLWQSTAAAICIGFIAVGLRHYSARIRFWLWMAASAKFCVPISMLIVLGSHLRAVPVAPALVPAVVLWQLTEPFSSVRPTAVSVTAPNATAVNTKETPTHRRGALPYILPAAWFCGFAFCLFSWSRRWRTARVAAREAHPVAFAEGVPILASTSLIEPGVFGIVRPKIVVPEGITDRLTEEQFSAVVAHELCHIRRGDNLAATFHMLVEAVFWFHPLIWWIGKQLLEERERACDEAVLQAGNEASSYAEGILNVCKLYFESPLPCVSGVTGSDLAKRMVRIVAGQVARPLDLSRKLLLSIAGLAAVVAPVGLGLLHVAQVRAQNAATQDITGTWQGTLHAGKDLRTVLKISKGDGNSLKAQMYSIDQGPGAIPITSISLQGSTLKYSIMMIDGSYEGKLSADGKTISGTWTQGNHPLPLEFKRTTPDTEWTIPEPPARMTPMPADAKPVFEVATIKPTKPDTKGKAFQVRGHEVRTINTSLNDLITFAYGVHVRQISGGPSWIGDDKFDVQGQPDLEGAPNDKQLKSMVQKLLADRFKLTFHNEQKDLSVYALTVAKGGPKLTKSQGDPNGLPGMFFRGLGVLPCQNATMADLAGVLQGAVLDRPVVDQTGLAGRFDFMLKWTPDESQFGGLGIKVPPPSNAADAPPNLFAAVQEELGLKLDSTKASVNVMVIDHVEKPSEN